jgi:hypothetical protein
MGHNHWVLVDTCKQLQMQIRRKKIEAFVEKAVQSYSRETSGARFARAIQFASGLARRSIDG